MARNLRVYNSLLSTVLKDKMRGCLFWVIPGTQFLPAEIIYRRSRGAHNYTDAVLVVLEILQQYAL